MDACNFKHDSLDCAICKLLVAFIGAFGARNGSKVMPYLMGYVSRSWNLKAHLDPFVAWFGIDTTEQVRD